MPSLLGYGYTHTQRLFKISTTHAERRDIAKYFGCGNIQLLLIKQEKSDFVFQGSVLPQQKCSAMPLLSEWHLELFEQLYCECVKERREREKEGGIMKWTVIISNDFRLFQDNV